METAAVQYMQVAGIRLDMILHIQPVREYKVEVREDAGLSALVPTKTDTVDTNAFAADGGGRVIPCS
ncbi:hypothetical protein [Peribacillus sp. SCS-155]|uniref:hypothetical protein n=1 Tax=Peribacillus sedimenti TaxID=3115297 RepID=UPI00390632BE